MPDPLPLLPLDGLADLGRTSVQAFWIPIVAWTALAAIGEAALRLTRVHPMVAVRVRSALLLALPLAVLAPLALAALLPDAAHVVAAVRPSQLVLPEIAFDPLPVEAAPAPPTGWVLLGLATLGVLIASAIGFARWAWALIRLRTVRAALTPASESLLELAAQMRQDIGLRQPVVLLHCKDGTAPFTFGWRRPVIAVPPALTGPPLHLALAHELAHVRHRDFLWNAIEQGIAALAVAHPLVRVLARNATLGREQAADADVLAAQPQERQAYADLLLSYASLPAPGLTLGATQGSSFLQTRIAAMTRLFSSSQLRQLAAAGRALGALAILVLVGAATTLAVPEAAAALTPPEWLEGRVTDVETEMGIVGANLIVEVEGSDPIGASTGPDGTYRLRRPEGAFAVLVTAAGYIPRSVLVTAEQRQLDVTLRRSTNRIIAGPPDNLEAMAPDIYEVVEQPPRLIGGLAGLQQRVVYPASAKADGVEGRVFIQFVVDEQGRVTEPIVRRSPDARLSDAAMEAVQASEFEPGQQRGQAVKVRYSLPVNFVLRDDGTEESPDRTRAQAPMPEVFEVVEQPPRLIGGLEGLQRRVVYPAEAREAGIEGRVFVSFIVDEQGRVQDPEVVRSADPLLDEAALRAVRESEFEPGQQRGVAVKVRYSLPINFRLPSTTGSDGQDRGSYHERNEQRPRLLHAGVDLTVLANAGAIEAMMIQLMMDLDSRNSPPSDVEYRYTYHPDGTNSDIRVVRSVGASALAETGADIVDAMLLRADRRAPTPREGMFRLVYTGS